MITLRRLGLTCLFVLSQACMTTPGDGQRVTSKTSTITFQGYSPLPGATVSIKAYYWGFGWFTVGTTTTSTSPVSVWDNDWYYWSKTLTLSSGYWVAGSNGGFRARVYSTDGENNLVSVRTDFSDCLSENLEDINDFAQNCVSHRYPYAEVYTADYEPGPANCSTLPSQFAALPLNLTTIPACRRQYIADRIEDYIDRDVIDEHYGIHHSHADHFFTHHRVYLKKLERYLMVYGDQWLPDGTLPQWNGYDAIPTEFQKIKTPPENCQSQTDGCSGWYKQAFSDTTPSVAKPFSIAPANICSLDLYELFDAVSPWHGSVHTTVGGTFGTFDSPAAVLFWPWHKHVDKIYQNWLSCP